ncbi:cobalamin biosynthesis protein [Trinickia sp. LjRoot230]|uniref:CobD/CbiB family cobalamin biosynthesis protein n=1 Tax=Trinickia sp. LjRoot230 TaxID=3342288 RepID=UPI003ECF689B
MMTLLLPFAATAALAGAGVAVDAWVGEPRRGHPLVAFGHMAKRIERALNHDHDRDHHRDDGLRPSEHASAAWPHRNAVTRMLGVLAWVLAVVPPVAIAVMLTCWLPVALACVVHVALLWFALGTRSLVDHLSPIQSALAAGDLVQARALASRIVTRELADADASAVARAAVESALENGNDAIFGALFWFAVAGGPGALAYRLINTLDAMWGYRTVRFVRFGWAAARLDDLANYVPARLTAAAYALCGDTRTAWRCWRTQASAWDSPNAGPVMASGAGSLNVACGGTARYHGIDESRPPLGTGNAPSTRDVGRALSLVKRALALWLAALALLALLSMMITV